VREQQKSKLPRKGETESHIKARERMEKMLEKAKWYVKSDCPLAVFFYFTDKLGNRIRGEPVKGEPEYYHEYDIYARKKHNNGLTSEMIIEIDGSSHDKPTQKGRDSIAENYAAFFLPDARFIRIPISLLLNQNMNMSNATLLDSYGIK